MAEKPEGVLAEGNGSVVWNRLAGLVGVAPGVPDAQALNNNRAATMARQRMRPV